MKKDLNCSGIYQIRNLVNDKVYIGSAVNMRHRRNCHFSDLNKNIHCNDYLQKSFNKYKEINFKFEVLERVNDKKDLIKQEQYWIDKTKCTNDKYGYNLCPTAENSLGYKHTEETLKKMSTLRMGKTYRIGMKHTEESKNKMAESNYKRFSDKNNREIISKGLKKYYKTKAGKKSIVACSRRLKENPMRKKGYKHTEKTRNKFCIVFCKPVVQMNKEQTKIINIYFLIKDLKNDNYTSSGVSKCCIGKLKTHRKCKWIRLEDLTKNTKLIRTLFFKDDSL